MTDIFLLFVSKGQNLIEVKAKRKFSRASQKDGQIVI